MDRNKPFFTASDIQNTISKYEPLIRSLRTAKTIKEWNTLRQSLDDVFPGSPKEQVMLFGYIDHTLHPEVFKSTPKES